MFQRFIILQCVFLVGLFLSSAPIAVAASPVERSAQTSAENETEPLQELKEFTHVIWSKIAQEVSILLKRGEDALSSLLRVKSIEVHGNYRLSPEEVRHLALPEFVENQQFPFFWSVSKNTVESRLLRNPWVKSVRVDWRYYPRTLLISVQEEDIWLVAETEHSNWLVSRAGTLLVDLDSLQNSDLILETVSLPRLRGIQEDPQHELHSGSGERSFANAIKMLTSFEAAGGFPFTVDSYELLEDGAVRVFLAPEQPVNAKSLILPQEVILRSEDFASAEIVLTRLQAVLIDITKRGQAVAKIDLRFEDRAVVE